MKQFYFQQLGRGNRCLIVANEIRAAIAAGNTIDTFDMLHACETCGLSQPARQVFTTDKVGKTEKYLLCEQCYQSIVVQ